MLQTMSKEAFVSALTSDQPNIPAYFGHSVLSNKKGNSHHKSSIQKIAHLDTLDNIHEKTIIIDTRDFNTYHNYPIHTDAINIPQKNDGFVTLL